MTRAVRNLYSLAELLLSEIDNPDDWVQPSRRIVCVSCLWGPMPVLL